MSASRFEKYAEALFSLAKEEGKVKAYQEALKKVGGVFLANPSFESFLASYTVPEEASFKALEEEWGEIPLKSLVSFLKLLVDKHLIDHFEQIERAFDVLADEAQGIEEGIAFSAEKLTEQQLHDLEKAIGEALGKKVALENAVQPSLLGGVRVNVGGKVYDGSLETKLESLRQQLLANSGGNKQ